VRLIGSGVPGTWLARHAGEIAFSSPSVAMTRDIREV